MDGVTVQINSNSMLSIALNTDYKLVTPTYPDKYFDWAICDIPYGINIAKKAHYGRRSHSKTKHSKTKNLSVIKRSEYPIKSWDSETLPQEYFEELKRVSINQIIFGADYTDWTGLGKGRIKWDKGVAVGVSFNRYEYAYCSVIDYELTIPLLWTGMLQAKSLKEPMTQQGNKKLNEKRIHPCHKPVMLYNAIYKRFNITGMKVLDTHLGSGSNRITADIFHCHFIGCEIDPEYFKLEEIRWLNYKNQLKMNL